MQTDNISNKIVDFIFSKDYRKYLIGLIILGGLLRYLLINNISFLGDEMVHGPHAINILSTNKLGMLQQSILWFYLTDITYKMLGVTVFSARFLSFFFGILSIIIIYLLTKEVFDKKIAIISSFLLAFSPFVIRYTLIEMDITMMFFVLLGIYFFIKGLKKDKLSYESALFFGIATLIKSIAIFFIFACGIIYFYYKYKTAEDKRELLKQKDWKEGLYFSGIIFLIYLPVLIHNYLLYKSKQIVDVYFAQYFGISRELYSGLAGYDQGFSIINMITGTIQTIIDISSKLDPINFLLGVLGIILIFKYKEDIFKKFIIILITIPFLIQSGSNTLATHYTNFIPFLCIFGAYGLVFIENKMKDRYKNILVILLGIILIINIFLIPVGNPLINSFTSKSANIQMRDYTIKEIGENDIVIVDSRIYRGRIAWEFNDKIYIESSKFQEFDDKLKGLGGDNILVNLYYIECATDDCGWGTVKDQPDFNASMESITDLFKKNTQLVKTLNGGGGYNEDTGVPYFNIYKAQINVKQDIYEYIESTHDWFYYPLRWQRDWYDSYKTNNLIDKIIDILGHIILWFAILTSILIPLYLFYLIYKEE